MAPPVSPPTGYGNFFAVRDDSLYVTCEAKRGLARAAVPAESAAGRRTGPVPAVLAVAALALPVDARRRSPWRR